MRSHIFIFPQCAFNSYSLHPLQWRGDREKSQYVERDFIIHFAGKKGDLKLGLIKYYLSQSRLSESRVTVGTSNEKKLLRWYEVRTDSIEILRINIYSASTYRWFPSIYLIYCSSHFSVRSSQKLNYGIRLSWFTVPLYNLLYMKINVFETNLCKSPSWREFYSCHRNIQRSIVTQLNKIPPGLLKYRSSNWYINTF